MSYTDLILGPGGDPVLLGDELDDLGLVEEDGLVQRRRAVLCIGKQFILFACFFLIISWII